MGEGTERSVLEVGRMLALEGQEDAFMEEMLTLCNGALASADQAAGGARLWVGEVMCGRSHVRV